jgi:hypothetical protein
MSNSVWWLCNVEKVSCVILDEKIYPTLFFLVSVVVVLAVVVGVNIIST